MGNQININGVGVFPNTENIDANKKIGYQLLSNEVNTFDSSETLLRKGGFSDLALDLAAFGFTEESVHQLSPRQLTIKWKDDLAQVHYEISNGKISPYQWSEKVNLSEPVDVTFNGKQFILEDGHHRYFAAKTLGKKLNVALTINANPILALRKDGDYDQFHRDLFQQLKKMRINEEIARDFKLAALKFLTGKLKIDSKVQLEDGAPNVEAGDKIADVFFPKAGIFTLAIKADDTFEFIKELAHELVHVKQIEDKRLKLITPGLVEFDGEQFPLEGENFKSDESDTPFDKEANAMTKSLCSDFWHHLNLKEENIKFVKEAIVKRSFIKGILTLEDAISATSIKEVQAVADWLKKPIGQVIFQMKEIPAKSFEEEVLHTINTLKYVPNDKVRVESLYNHFRNDNEMMPVFVDSNTNTILMGQYRLVAYFLLDKPVVPIIYVE